MKVVLFVVAALAAIQAIDCFYVAKRDNQELIEQINRAKARFQERLTVEAIKSRIDAACPGYGDRFENVTVEIQSCAALIDESRETMCSIIKNHFERCMKPLTDMFEECLPAKSKKIPSLIIKIIIATFNHLCKTDGEHIFELGKSCVKKTNAESEVCMQSAVVKFQQKSRKNKYPSPDDLCELMKSFRSCLQSHLNSACKNPITRESFLQIYDEGLSVCKTYEQNEVEE